MNTEQFKLKQFDVASASANTFSCNLLRACAQPLLDPTCSTSHSFFSLERESFSTMAVLLTIIEQRGVQCGEQNCYCKKVGKQDSQTDGAGVRGVVEEHSKDRENEGCKGEVGIWGDC